MDTVLKISVALIAFFYAVMYLLNVQWAKPSSNIFSKFLHFSKMELIHRERQRQDKLIQRERQRQVKLIQRERQRERLCQERERQRHEKHRIRTSCPDCGSFVSTMAYACPKCGRAGQAALEQGKYIKGIYLVISMVVSWLFVQYISSIREEGRKDRTIKANLELQRTINDPRATEGDYRRAYEKVLNP
jgi:hypothetical protein